MKKLIAIFIFLAIGFIAYSNIYNNELVFDDVEIISNNLVIKDISNLKLILTSNYWHEQANAGLYRPLVYLSFAIDYFFWGDNCVGYHFFNIIFHLMTCVMFFFILKFFIKNELPVLVAVIVYAVHPVHCEAVTGVVGRAEVFSTFFFCVGWLLFLKFFKSGKEKLHLYAGSLTVYFFALASKENSVVLPAVLFISGLYLDKSKILKRNWIIKIFSYGFVFLAYFLIRFSVLGTIGPAGTEQFFYNKSFMTVFCTMCRAFAWYFKLFFIPTGLICSYRHWALSHSLLDLRVVISLFIIISWVASSLLFFRSRRKHQFFLLFILITLLPVSNIIKFGDLMAERFLYLPSIGFCAFFVLLMDNLLEKLIFFEKSKRRVLFWLLVINLFLISLLARNNQWRDGIIFWQTTIRDMPNSYSAYYNLGAVYYEKGLKRKALYCVSKSLKINPNAYPTRKLYGMLLYETSQYEDAVFRLKNLIKEKPEDQDLYEKLALTYLSLSDYKNALLVCADGIVNAAKKNIVFYAAVRIYLNQNKPNESLEVALNAVSYDPSDSKAYTKAGICYLKLDNYTEATRYFKKAILLDDKNIEAIDNLADIYFKQKNYAQAVVLWEKIINFYPSRDYFWYYVGLAHEKQNNIQGALRAYQRVRRTESYKLRAARRIKLIKDN